MHVRMYLMYIFTYYCPCPYCTGCYTVVHQAEVYVRTYVHMYVAYVFTYILLPLSSSIGGSTVLHRADSEGERQQHQAHRFRSPVCPERQPGPREDPPGPGDGHAESSLLHRPRGQEESPQVGQ